MSGPLAGCRVLDLGIITAGAAAGALLADLGAEVIKVESPGYHDPFRAWLTISADGSPSTNPFFRFTNRGKQAVCIDIKRPAGRDAFLALAARSDVVVENFRRGVMRRLGINYAALRAVQPAIILAAISSQGETGPDADYVSFGTTLEAMSGLAARTGYADAGPSVTGRDLNYPDQVVATFAAGMVVTAWRHRQRTGEGAHLDLSQRELTSFLCGEAFVADAPAEGCAGNADALYALQECVKAADGGWLACSVRAEQRAALEALLGGAAAAPLLPRLAQWAAGRSAAAGAQALLARGIAAAPVLDGSAVLADRGRRWRTALTDLPDGSAVKGFPFQFDRHKLTVSSDAPALGADTDEVLRRVAGYTDAELRELRSSGTTA